MNRIVKCMQYSSALFLYEAIVHSQCSGNEKLCVFKNMRRVVEVTGTSSVGIFDLRVAVCNDESTFDVEAFA
jgi:hypothetical protein